MSMPHSVSGLFASHTSARATVGHRPSEAEWALREASGLGGNLGAGYGGRLGTLRHPKSDLNGKESLPPLPPKRPPAEVVRARKRVVKAAEMWERKRTEGGFLAAMLRREALAEERRAEEEERKKKELLSPKPKSRPRPKPKPGALGKSGSGDGAGGLEDLSDLSANEQEKEGGEEQEGGGGFFLTQLPDKGDEQPRTKKGGTAIGGVQGKAAKGNRRGSAEEPGGGDPTKKLKEEVERAASYELAGLGFESLTDNDPAGTNSQGKAIGRGNTSMNASMDEMERVRSSEFGNANNGDANNGSGGADGIREGSGGVAVGQRSMRSERRRRATMEDLQEEDVEEYKGYPSCGFKLSDIERYDRGFQKFSGGAKEMDRMHFPQLLSYLGHSSLLVSLTRVKELGDSLFTFSTVDLGEFLTFMAKYIVEERGSYEDAFNAVDKDRTGEIETSEIRELIVNIGWMPNDDMVQELIDCVDVDGTGELNFPEFLRMMKILRDTEGFTEPERLELEEVFTKFDKDGSGEISTFELEKILFYLGFRPRRDELEKLVAEVDFDGSGEISIMEFRKVMRLFRDKETKGFRKFFDMHDADKSGKINTVELAELFAGMNYTPTKEMLAEALEVVDKDGGGEIDFDEFCKLLKVYRDTDGFTRAELANLRRVFETFDRQEDGEVNTVELGNMLRYLGYAPTFDQCRALGHQVDIDGSGEISMHEFLKAVRRYVELEMDSFRKQFREKDLDGSGSISTVEIGNLLESMGYRPTPQAVKAVCSLVDKDNSGELDFDEFCHLMKIYRESAAKEHRARAGFSDDEVAEFRQTFHQFDKDRSGKINAQELFELLQTMGKAPKNPAEQMALQEKIKHAVQQSPRKRSKDGGGERESQKVGRYHHHYRNSDDGAELGQLRFEDFLQLMRRFTDDAEMAKIQKEKDYADRCNFSQEEVGQFREIFNEFDGELTGEVGILEIRRMLRALNMKLDANMYERLKELMNEATGGKSERCEFPEFLMLMKKMIDLDFAGMNTAAREALVKAGMMPAWSGVEKVLTATDSAMIGELINR